MYSIRQPKLMHTSRLMGLLSQSWDNEIGPLCLPFCFTPRFKSDDVRKGVFAVGMAPTNCAYMIRSYAL